MKGFSTPLSLPGITKAFTKQKFIDPIGEKSDIKFWSIELQLNYNNNLIEFKNNAIPKIFKIP